MFKPEVVRRITDQSKSLAELSRKLNLGESMLRNWKEILASEGDRAIPATGPACS